MTIEQSALHALETDIDSIAIEICYHEEKAAELKKEYEKAVEALAEYKNEKESKK